MQDLIAKIKAFRDETIVPGTGIGSAVVNGYKITVEEYNFGQTLYTVTEEGDDGETAEFWDGEFQSFAVGHLRWCLETC